MLKPKPKTKSKLKSTTAPFKPVVAKKPEPSEPVDADDDDEPELEAAASVKRDIVRRAGARAPPPSNWMTLNDTAKYLRVSPMSIHRYVDDPNYAHLNFPKPSVLVDRCYWHVDDIDAWMRSRVGAVSSRKIKTKGAVA